VSLRAGKIFHGGIDDSQSWTEGGDPPRPDGKRIRSSIDPAQRRLLSDRIVVLDGDGEAHVDYKTADRAIEYLQRYKDRPFFLACGFTKPHSPPTAPQKWFDRYEASQEKLPVNFAPRVTIPNGFPAGCLTKSSDLFIDRDASESEAREMRKAYHASISWCDWNLGRVVAELDRLGLRRNTIIVFWGDHGYHLGEFGKWSKHGSLFEVGTRVPLIVVTPDCQPAVVTAPVETLDLYPTLCDLCGLPRPEGIQGESLTPLFKDPTRRWDRPAFSVAGSLTNLGVAVRTHRYRYAEYKQGTHGTMLFDEHQDPHELTNLADHPDYASLRAELSALVKAHAAGVRP
jgi:arylsulfatase A-like enzyme